MEKYINIKQLYQCETCSHHFSGKCDTWCECGESYRPAMALLNIVEAEEVRHGEWKPRTGLYYDYYCSNCDGDAIEYENSYGSVNYHLTDYCYHCGAKMDGKKEED